MLAFCLDLLVSKFKQLLNTFTSLYTAFIVIKAEVILPTFSRDKSILLLNCPLDA